MDHAHFPVKAQKISNSRQIQDRVKSRTRPWNKGLSWKILHKTKCMNCLNICTLQWTLEQKLINNFNYCLQQHYH